MKHETIEKHPPEILEKLEEIKVEIRERMKYDDFNWMQVEEIFEDFGLEPDYIIEVISEF